MNYKGHVLYTKKDFKHLTPEQKDTDITYDLVVSAGLSICKICGDYESGLDKPCKPPTIKVEGQCFDCHSQATFQYHGQTAGFSELKMQLDYVAALMKPSTTVHCKICKRTLKYTEQNGKWITELCNRE